MAYPRSYTISSAFLEQDTPAQMVVSSTTTTWILSLFGAFLLIIFGIFLASAGGTGLLVALLPLSFAMALITGYPYSSKLTFDYSTCQVTFLSKYLLRVPRQVIVTQTFAEGLQADMTGGGGLLRRSTVVLRMADNVRILMPFSQVVDAENLLLRVARLQRYHVAQPAQGQAAGTQSASTQYAEERYLEQQRRAGEAWGTVVIPAGETVEGEPGADAASTAVPEAAVAAPAAADEPAAETALPVEDVDDPAFIERQKAHQRAELRAALAVQLQSRVQSWVVWLVLIAVVQFAASPGEVAPWGVMLILVALTSLIFKDPALFVVYAVIIGWAGLENLLFADDILWKGFSLLQGYWAIQLVQEFTRYRKLEQHAAEPGMPPQHSRAAAWFPWVSMSLGGLSILLILGGFLFLVASAAATGTDPDTTIFSISFTTGLYMAILGLAYGLGAWLSRYPYRFAAIIGTVLSALTLIGIVILSLG